MSTPLTAKEEEERARREREWVVRAVTCALHHLSALDDAWFVYDASEMVHQFVHNGERFLISKENHSRVKPPMLVFKLTVPSSSMEDFKVSLWILNPEQDTSNSQVYATDYR
ncbi:hypothetical protein C8Q76DRAFT_798012 [Earliella scabrosa]|nr:hypothetical protein C8Q76DRAFT_798012 [Earliella scabrosa]